ncbi:DUF3519 domain-containing protein [Helicobacter pylori]|uniref:PBECR3 domain-containing polyvalent protein n=1 Tax=Helicobacter pylori TaxID=210 RepID=UPI001E358767|nr:DUF3519 domain-containing protein [Helicobacter pylori]
MEQSLKQDESLKVFDSAQFFNKLNEFKDDVFTTPAAKEYIDIASGFHKLFKNDARIAESLNPATTKNLSQGLATTLSGALKYQWTKFTLGTLYRNAPDRILGVKLPKALNEATAGAALKYHIKRALERSHSISDFSKQLELSAKNSKFTNNTLKIIEELNNGVKQASEEIKEATKPSNLIKSIREQDTRHFEVIEDKEAFFKDLNKNLEANATPLPKGMSVEEFKKSLESVGNKDRFLEHLKTRDNSDERLAALNLVEPILREPHIEIFIKDNATDKKEYFKAFKDENKARLYMLITQDNDTILRTFIPDTPERYVRNHVRNADIIHSFIQPNRTAKSDNALSSDVVVYENNTTQKPLTSQEDLLKTSENLNETTQNAYLSDIMDRSFANLKNYQSTSDSLKDLSEKFYKTSSLEMFEKSDQSVSDISEILGGAIARFARFDDPSKALFEALKSDNIKKGLKEFKIADVTKDMFNPDSKEFKDIDIYDFTHYLLMADREPNENNPTLKRLIEAVKDMQKENAKGIKEASRTSAEETKKGIKRDYSDTNLSNDEIKKLINESPRTGSSMPILGMQNLHAGAVEYIQKNHKRIAVEKIEPRFAKDLKLKYPDDARAVIDYQAINHILKEHKNLAFEDIANYRELSKQANETLKLKDNQNRPVVASFNQINGFFVVVEQVSNAKNELMLKTMYKERENYKDSLIYKKTLAKYQNSNCHQL